MGGRRNRFAAAAVAMAALALAACQASRSTAGDDIVGVYRLVEVDGAAVPGPVSHDGVEVHIESGELAITADGSCSSKTVFARAGGAKTAREVRASWERRDDRLVMRWEGAGVTEGTFRGDTFVMDNHGTLFEYARQGE